MTRSSSSGDTPRARPDVVRAQQDLERIARAAGMNTADLQHLVLDQRSSLAADVTRIWNSNRAAITSTLPDVHSPRDLEDRLVSLRSVLRTNVEAAESKSTFMKLVTGATAPFHWALNGAKKALALPLKAGKWLLTHPFKTAGVLGLGALALYFGSPYLAGLFGEGEGWLANVPMNRISQVIRSLSPFSNTVSPPPALDTVVPPEILNG